MNDPLSKLEFWGAVPQVFIIGYTIKNISTLINWKRYNIDGIALYTLNIIL